MSTWLPIAFQLETPDLEVPIGKVYNALLAMALSGFRVRLVPGHDAGLGVVVVEVDPAHDDDEIEQAFATIRSIPSVRQVVTLAETRRSLDGSPPPPASDAAAPRASTGTHA